MSNDLQSSANIQTYLSFRLDEEVFAITVFKVLNILEMRPITKVPQSPEYMKGVINLRGNVLPVIDLRVKFGMPAIEQTVDTCIIVLNLNMGGDTVLLGIQVDAVKEVLELREDQIEPSPSIGTKYNNTFIQGMFRVNENFIMILNIDKVFASEDIVSVKESAEGQQVSEVKE